MSAPNDSGNESDSVRPQRVETMTYTETLRTEQKRHATAGAERVARALVERLSIVEHLVFDHGYQDSARAFVGSVKDIIEHHDRLHAETETDNAEGDE